MFDVGDIVSILAPSVGYRKYHLCITRGELEVAALFLWLNSDPNFRSTYNVACDRVPCIPPSKTGFTCFSFGMMPRYSDSQLQLYQATKHGVLDSSLASELEAFAMDGDNVRGLNAKERRLVLTALASLTTRSLHS